MVEVAADSATSRVSGGNAKGSVSPNSGSCIVLTKLPLRLETTTSWLWSAGREFSASATNNMKPALPSTFRRVSISEGPVAPTVNRYFPGGTMAFCQRTSWVKVKVPTASWAEARLGVKFRKDKKKKKR